MAVSESVGDDLVMMMGNGWCRACGTERGWGRFQNGSTSNGWGYLKRRALTTGGGECGALEAEEQRDGGAPMLFLGGR